MAAHPLASTHGVGDIVKKSEGILSLVEEYERGLCVMDGFGVQEVCSARLYR